MEDRKKMGKFLFILIIILLIATSLGAAEDLDYYFEASTMRAGGVIFLNGFPIFESSGGTESISRWITPFLINGENTLRVCYLPTKKSNENSDIEFSICSHPHGKKRSDELEKKIIQKQFASRTLWLYADAPELKEIDFIFGGLSKDKDIVFENLGQSRILGFSLPKDKAFARIPSRIEYMFAGINRHELKNVRIHLLRSGEAPHVTFGEIEMKPAMGEIELERDKIIKGLECFHETGFDTVIIQGQSEETGDIEISSLKFFEIYGDIEEEYQFRIAIEQKWSWQEGEKIKNMPKDIEEELWNTIVRIHHDLGQGNLDKGKEIFRLKVKDFSLALHKPLAKMEAEQSNFFERITKDPNWGLVPISRKNFRYYAINDKVVKVETLDGKEIIVSKSIKDPGGQENSFAIPLYLSRINGKWKVVR